LARRILGIDLGDRRIGVALGDMETRTATPLTTLRRAKTVAADARTLARLAAEQRVEALIVGLPLEMSGSEGPQAARTREWAGLVAETTGLPVRFRDERLSSVRAEGRLGKPARGRSGGPPTAAQREAQRRRVDREAATLILQDELDAPGGPAGGER
jgi:putative Holliday junction resolvase